MTRPNASRTRRTSRAIVASGTWLFASTLTADFSLWVPKTWSSFMRYTPPKKTYSSKPKVHDTGHPPRAPKFLPTHAARQSRLVVPGSLAKAFERARCAYAAPALGHRR